MEIFFLSSTAEMLTVGLVILNTLVMALEHEPKTDSFDEFLDIANNVSNFDVCN